MQTSLFGPVVQLVRMPACHAGGRGFEPLPGRQIAQIAQLVEQWTENPRVAGSIPALGTTVCGFNSAVECHLAKVKVASSNLVTRSNKASCLNVAGYIIRRHSQVVRQRSAKPLFPSSNLGGASKYRRINGSTVFYFSLNLIRDKGYGFLIDISYKLLQNISIFL
jgi:hypothetical protein